MSTTIVTKRNAIATHLFRELDVERKRPTENRLSAMRKAMEVLEPLEVSLSDPLGEFLVDILELAPRLPDPHLGGEYDRWLDDVDSSRFELPEDYTC